MNVSDYKAKGFVNDDGVMGCKQHGKKYVPRGESTGADNQNLNNLKRHMLEHHVKE